MSADQDELLAAAMKGQQAALERLLLVNFDSLAVHVRSRIPAQLRATVDAEDLVQETYKRVFRDFSTFRGEKASAFQAWLRTIADARRVDAIRAATRKKRGGEHSPVSAEQSFLELLDLLSGEERSPSKKAAVREAVDALQDAVAGLPHEQQEVVWLRYIENLTLSEVAEAAGRTEDAVRGLLHRGKAALKAAMGNSSAWFSKIG